MTQNLGKNTINDSDILEKIYFVYLIA